jgi:hypothetical protein
MPQREIELNTILIILQLLPALLQAIVAIESTAPVPKVGPAKASLLAKVISTVPTEGTFGKHVISQDQLLSIIQAITISIVSFYNLVGIFKTTSAPTVAPVAPAASN